MDLPAFDFQPRTRVVFGVGTVERVGELALELGATKVLLVTDPGIVQAGHAERVRQALDASKLDVVLFDQVKENPTTREVDACLAVARGSGIDLLIGLGGGSSMDTAKGCNFVLTNGGRLKDYWGVGKAARPMLPLVAIPTTAGTGSECQSFALIADEATHLKMACGDPKAAAKIAILDPTLTLSQPQRVTACTGVDAIAHAVETAVTRKRNGLSLLFSREAFARALMALPRVLEAPHDLAARGMMQWAAALAGMAIENSMLGAAHSAANPLTAHSGVVHGVAVGVMLPLVVRLNGQDAQVCADYADLAVATGLARRSDEPKRALAALVARLEHLLNLADIPRALSDCGVNRSAIPKLAVEAAAQWTAGFNPRAVLAADFERLYHAAFEPRGDGDFGKGWAESCTRAGAGGARA